MERGGYRNEGAGRNQLSSSASSSTTEGKGSRKLLVSIGLPNRRRPVLVDNTVQLHNMRAGLDWRSITLWRTSYLRLPLISGALAKPKHVRVVEALLRLLGAPLVQAA